MKTIAAMPAYGLLLALAIPGQCLAQEVEPITESSQSYGYELVVPVANYGGEEIETRDGRVIKYRQSDPYDEYEDAEGANATFVDMATGNSQLVVPKDSDLMVFYLNVVYSKSDPDIGIGYVARVGTKTDYAKGRIDVIVGRFSDLYQSTVFQNVRFVDSPTNVSDDSISMIVWHQDDQAKHVVIDVNSFEMTNSKNIDLPIPVEIIRKPCPCDESGNGERLEVYSPWKDKGGGAE